ncbi:MAG: cytochrome P450 [Rhodovarius sp.]|nr:cytochrome P450 [Rhodovarius sp.]
MSAATGLAVPVQPAPAGHVPFVPPRPTPGAAVVNLVRVLLRGDGDLLTLLPRSAYRVKAGWLGWSRRSILIVNDPAEVRRVLSDPEGIFPKSDLMVEALDPLIGDSIFVSSGATWQRQRRMLDPSLSMMRVHRAFPAMQAAAAAMEEKLDEAAAEGRPVSLDLTMSHLTADVICRTVFSTTLDSQVAHDVFDAFSLFERSVAQVRIRRLIFDPAFKKVAQPPHVLAACRLIRRHLGDLLDTHLAAGAAFDDICQQVIEARDLEDGSRFSREELIDQLGVLFLAGHETSASALTWAFYLLAVQPGLLARLRAEVEEVTGGAEISFEHTKRLVLTRHVFRETLRLYPPITFLPRVAMERTEIAGYRVRRGALIMVAPWVLHRHRLYWRDPDAFDPDRFLPEREGELTPGAYIPFGIGPRVCAGAAFAQAEAVLMIARLFRRYDVEVLAPEEVRPAARLTTRPVRQVMVRLRRRRA